MVSEDVLRRVEITLNLDSFWALPHDFSIRYEILHKCIPSRRSRRVVRFRVWNTSSLVILAAYYINAAVFCTVGIIPAPLKLLGF